MYKFLNFLNISSIMDWLLVLCICLITSPLPFFIGFVVRGKLDDSQKKSNS